HAGKPASDQRGFGIQIEMQLHRINTPGQRTVVCALDGDGGAHRVIHSFPFQFRVSRRRSSAFSASTTRRTSTPKPKMRSQLAASSAAVPNSVCMKGV